MRILIAEDDISHADDHHFAGIMTDINPGLTSHQVRPHRSDRRRNLTLLACTALWALVVGGGLWLVWSYEKAPGASASPSAHWPDDSRIERAKDRATLIMLAHPHCPCTRASIGELALIMARSQGRVTAYVLFVKPPDATDGWEETDLRQSAASIPGVRVVTDDGGIEAGRFRAATSGQTVLYDAQGRLLFSGGITGSRGHSGDNAGRSAVVSLLMKGEAEQTETSVFGCPLSHAGSECPASGRERNHAAN